MRQSLGRRFVRLSKLEDGCFAASFTPANLSPLFLSALKIAHAKKLLPAPIADSAGLWLKGQGSGAGLRRALAFIAGIANGGESARGAARSMPASQLSFFLRQYEFFRELPADESSAYLLGEGYQAMLELDCSAAFSGDAKRKRSGSFFTPAPLVERLWELAGLDSTAGECHICDPAAGAGYFLLAAARRKRSANLHLYGIDADSVAIRLARLAFWLEAGDPERARLVHGDALAGPAFGQSGRPFACAEAKAVLWAKKFPEVARRGGFDIVVGNPPYEALTRFASNPAAKAYAQAVRDCGWYRLALTRQINLYRLFIERALALLRPSGRLALVVPASFLADASAANLRTCLLREHALEAVDHYPESDRAFRGVGEAMVLFRATKGAGARPTLRLASSTFNRKEGAEDSGEARSEVLVKSADIVALGKEMPIPLARPEDWALIVWLRQHAPGKFSALAEGVVGEVDQTVYKRFIRGDKGQLLLRGEHLSAFHADLELRKEAGRFLDSQGFYGQKAKAAPSCRERVARERIAQLGIRNRECRPRLVAARLPAGIFYGNSLNVWQPRPGVPFELVLGLLNSSLYDWRFRLCSGNNNINIYEVDCLPLPERIATLAEQAAQGDGRAISELKRLAAPVVKATLAAEAAHPSSLPAARQRLDLAVAKFFCLHKCAATGSCL